MKVIYNNKCEFDVALQCCLVVQYSKVKLNGNLWNSVFYTSFDLTKYK